MTPSGRSFDREQLLQRRLARPAVPGPHARQHGTRDDRPHLSFGQQRIWFIDRLNPGSAAYTIPIAYRLRGDLELDALRHALAIVVQRHEALRTRFGVWEGQPFQVIEHTWPGLALQDLSGAVEPLRRAEEIMAEEAQSPFELATGPLFRARLLRLGHGDHVLLITVHHSVFDGWSLGVLTGELAGAYTALVHGREPDLGAPPPQYADFATWQRRHLDDERLADHLEYWRGRLAGTAEVLSLPTDRPRPRQPSYRGGAVTFTVPEANVRALRAIGREHAASLFMVALAAYQALLSRYAVASDVVVGVPIAGRDRRELEGMIGFFAQTVPIRSDLSGDPTFVELLQQVRDTFLDATAHQDLPFERLVEHLAPARHLSNSPIVQVLFNLLSSETGAGALRLPGLQITELATDEPSIRFDLEMHLFEAGSRLDGKVMYAADLFDKRTMSWFAAHYGNMLAAVAHDPSMRTSRIPIVTDEELSLMARWNAESNQSAANE
jgi:hypothetical protein